MITNIRFGRAREDYSDSGIKKGQFCYSWTLPNFPTQMSRRPPRSSRLTTSERVRLVRIAREVLGDFLWDVEWDGGGTLASITAAMDVAATSLQETSRLFAGAKEHSINHMIAEINYLAYKVQHDNAQIILKRAYNLPEWELF